MEIDPHLLVKAVQRQFVMTDQDRLNLLKKNKKLYKMNKRSTTRSPDNEATNLASLTKSEDSVEIGDVHEYLKKEEELSLSKSPKKRSP